MTARLIMKLRVDAAVPVTREVLHVTLAHPRRPTLPPWTPGAHVDLHLPDGRVRQYSLCGDRDDPSYYEIAIKREENGRGGSRWAHENLRSGTIVHVSAPRNNFRLATEASENAFIAGGIGITPIASMVRALAATDGTFHLHFCARSAEAAPLLGRLREICGSRLTCWFSSTGNRFDPAILGPPRPGQHVYVCGPQSLVDATKAELSRKGWPEAQRHIEHFEALRDDNFKPEPFDVEIASTGAILHVPAERSLLAVLREHGVAVPFSCEIGVCGSCQCGYRSGTVIHRDNILAGAARQDRMTPCVSRARGKLLLDV